jgi:hypothetical protein
LNPKIMIKYIGMARAKRREEKREREATKS